MSTSVQLSPLDRFSCASALTSTCMNRTSSPGAGGAASELPAVGGGSSRVVATAMATCSPPSLLPPSPAACRRVFVRPLTCELSRSGVRVPLGTTRARASLESTSSSSDTQQETIRKRGEGHGGGYGDELCGYGGSVRDQLAETTENRPAAASCHDSTTSGRVEDDGTWEAKLSTIARGLAKSMVVVLAAAALLASSPNGAMAAKSGGRVGGSAFRSAPRTGPSSGPRINSRTYINPPTIAPPIYGGGYGGGFFPFGGYGYSPFGYGFGPVIGIQGGGGLFQFMFFIFVANFVFNFIRNLTDRDED
ncbi:hypothetical protein CBR_g22376 [Chara braunii]|uniref:Uncharacterized protein n=1 Tax=Chara braunii TaxID=69332 RepID=A0A388JUT6_CHABU|nr:hypothetical protein CBR_g22376 [Chara braunii]|eukprot:GBG61579.1 hypothetical protein CBR_g22376 [Chara braunii]